jgi:hypothetical protein
MRAERTALRHHQVMPTDNYALWREDEGVLADLGAQLWNQDLTITVTIPRTLAEKAVRAWSRDDDGELRDETPREVRTRRRAGTLALIGLSIERSGRWNDDHVHAEVEAWYIGSALDAADEAGLISARSKE